MKALTILSFIFLITLQSALLADDTPEHEKYPYRATSTNPHDMRVINSGSASLYARIDMIRRAKESINLETFIFNDDTAGRLLIRELLAAAKRGVKVRVLVDKAINNIKFDEYHAQLLREQGVDLRFYNDASLFRISKVQYRNHRKLLAVDGKEAITGGRNIGDEYFDLNEKFNFLDRDVSIEGDLVPTMNKTFDRFFESAMTQNPKPIEEPKLEHYGSYENPEAKYKQDKNYYDYRFQKAKRIFDVTEEDEKKLAFVMEKGKAALEEFQKYKCPEASFASDREGASDEVSSTNKYRTRFRYLRKELSIWVKNKIKKKLMIDTPYFLDSEFTGDVDLKLSKNIEVDLLTNSVASTDAVHVSSVFYDFVSRFTPNDNFKAFTYKGKFAGEGELYNDKVRNATWGTHSKTMVFDDDSFMVGTINMDNRSHHFNTELAFFCSGSKELTADIQKSIEQRMKGSSRLNAEGLPDDCSDPFKEVDASKKALYYLLKMPSRLLQFLL